MICGNCQAWTLTSDLHRCRSDENSCVDGKNCPDYIVGCECECQK